ncbi:MULTISPECIES: ParA family protein [Actinomycetes]|uniref:ParA family protein n=1 Tax=Actinomycetes TaxID=1760 RepID=UPI00197CA289|nr:ParA family protein [Streptomyces sp. BPSDS2]
MQTTGRTLSEVRDQLVIAGVGREARLREALAPVVDDYDLILIDSAPSLDQLTINALSAADAAVIVTHTKKCSLDGLGQLLDTVENVCAYSNPSLRVAGVIVNQHEERTVGWCSTSGEQVMGLVKAGHHMFAEVANLERVDVVDLPTGHWPMWSRPRDLAEIIRAASHTS